MINSHFKNLHLPTQPASSPATSAHLSATALLQKAATFGATAITGSDSVPAAVAAVGVGHVTQLGMVDYGTVNQLDSVGQVSGISEYMIGMAARNLESDRLTRDFLGLNGGHGGNGGGAVDVSMNMKDMLTYAGGVEYHQPYDHHRQSRFKSQQGFGFVGTTTAPETWGNC